MKKLARPLLIITVFIVLPTVLLLLTVLGIISAVDSGKILVSTLIYIIVNFLILLLVVSTILTNRFVPQQKKFARRERFLFLLLPLITIGFSVCTYCIFLAHARTHRKKEIDSTANSVPSNAAKSNTANVNKNPKN